MLDHERLETKVIAQLQTALQPALDDVEVAWDDVPLETEADDKKSLMGTIGKKLGALLRHAVPAALTSSKYTQAPHKVPSILTGLYCPLNHFQKH